MFVIKFKQHGALNCEEQIFGPFDNYMDAEDALSSAVVPCLYGQGGVPWPVDVSEDEAYGARSGHRCIVELQWVSGCVL